MMTQHDSPLARELATFEEMRDALLMNHNGKFVVIKEGSLIGTWDTLDAAAKEAVQRFGRGPYLIRQVGVAPSSLPASVMFRTLQPA